MISRRRFMTTGSLAVAASAVLGAPGATAPAVDQLNDWRAIRQQFDGLDPTMVHLGLFYMASHPRPVRAAIERYRRQIEANPLLTIEHANFGNEHNLMDAASRAVAQ